MFEIDLNVFSLIVLTIATLIAMDKWSCSKDKGCKK